MRKELKPCTAGNERGVTFLELLITVTILLILASVAMPLSKYTSQRAQELELRRTLRTIRSALDQFRLDWAREGDILKGPLCVKNKTSCKDQTGQTGYPKRLETLLGVELSGGEATVRESGAVRCYLRRIPGDPITRTPEWGLRCYQDPPEAESWCGEDVFDVYSTSPDIAMNGSRYRDW